MEGMDLLWIVVVVSGLSLLFAILAFARSFSARASAEDVRNDLRGGREESRAAAKDLREEVGRGFTAGGETFARALEGAMNAQTQALGVMATRIEAMAASNLTVLERIRAALTEGITGLQTGNEQRLAEIRGTVEERVRELQSGMERQLTDSRSAVDGRLTELRDSNVKSLGDMRTEAADGLRATSMALKELLTDMSTGQRTQLEAMAAAQRQQLEAMTQQLKDQATASTAALEAIRGALDARVRELQESNEKKLEEMRKTVDDKLHETLERRLGESFQLVSQRLEAVQHGLGEMRTLASGVGDLKRALSNVKTRGGWAEMQLEALLQQTLTPEQFSKNVCVKEGSAERVEFAIKLPGPDNDPNSPLWIPIDSKFPQEDYLRLQEAADAGDALAVQAASDALIRAVKTAARDVHDKYLNPPVTSDFCVLFLATEGLFSEVLRRPALVEDLQTNYRVVVTGPANLGAFLTSLRMGFQSIAISKRASEVWKVLGAVKAEFGRFGEVLVKVQRHLGTASNTLEQAQVRTRAMERQLRGVEALPEAEAREVLALPTLAATLVAPDEEGVEREAAAETEAANE